jgi:hypothetical protein
MIDPLVIIFFAKLLYEVVPADILTASFIFYSFVAP